MKTIHLTEEDPDTATIDAVSVGLDAYNESRVGPDQSKLVWIIARDSDGAVQGGLRGVVLWSWFLVDWLWVADAHRGQGIGSGLLVGGEAAARQRGCTGAFLNTFTFQAPDFYRRHGYEEFGRLDDFPLGHARLWMRKALA